MTLDEARQLILKYEMLHQVACRKIGTAYRYYAGDNDIRHRPLRKPPQECRGEEDAMSLLRSADNRIAFNFHSLLVNQKASYLFTAPPIFDIGSDADNEKLAQILGDAYGKKLKDLCVDAANAGIGWIHYWTDEKKRFRYQPVPAIQIYPIFTDDLSAVLRAVLRSYKTVDENGQEWIVYEFWNDTTCEAYRRHADVWEPFDMFCCALDGMTVPTNVYEHHLGGVPFIPFRNNNLCSSDLDKIKDLCDAYDKTFSGFVDDLEDIQEVILVLTNYGGTDAGEFLRDLKYYKVINQQNAGDGDRSGVSTLTIDIPVEARDKLLELTRKAIFDMGQGVDPQQQSFDRTSGEAMKFMYSLLEMKAGMTETEFRLGLSELIRAACRLSGMADPKNIQQTWTRTAIRNDAELVNMCQQSVGLLSERTILKNHPFVDSVENELKEIEREKQEQKSEDDPYNNAFRVNGNGKEKE